MERTRPDFTQKLWKKNTTYLQEFRSCCKVQKKQTDKKVLYFQNLDLNENSNVNERL